MEKVSIEGLFSLNGKTVVITGGAGGIGRAVGNCMAAAGADIAFLDISLPRAQAAAEEIRRLYDVRTCAICCDVTDPINVAAALSEVETLLDHLDVLVNNAGVGLHKSCLEITPEEWRRVNDINYNGMFFVATEFARRLIAAGRSGAIINTASMGGMTVLSPQQQIAYNSSKAGVIHMTHTLAVELAEHHIRVNAVSPGYIATELIAKRPQEMRDAWAERTPQKRLGAPEELGAAYLYLASDGARFTTGCNLVVDGGYTLL